MQCALRRVIGYLVWDGGHKHDCVSAVSESYSGGLQNFQLWIGLITANGYQSVELKASTGNCRLSYTDWRNFARILVKTDFSDALSANNNDSAFLLTPVGPRQTLIFVHIQWWRQLDSAA